MKTRNKRKFLGSLFASMGCILIGLVILFPLLYGFFGSFKSAREFASFPPTFFPKSLGYLDNYAAVFQQVPVGRFYLNSLIVAVATAAVRLVIATLAAYAFAFFEFRGKQFLFIFLLGTMMLPADTLLITNYQTISHLGLLDTYLGMCIVSFVGASQMFMLRQRFKSSPVALREASQLDGCGDLRFIVSVLAPTSWPLMVTLFLQSFVASWNTYLWPLLVTNTNEMRTIQVGVTMLTSIEATNYETILAGVTVALLPAIVFFIILRRSMTGAMSSGGSLVG